MRLEIHTIFYIGMKRESSGSGQSADKEAHTAQTPRDGQQQVDTYHWSSWSPPSQAHTDRCLEQCSDRGHIYQHSGLSERKINQIRKLGGHN